MHILTSASRALLACGVHVPGKARIQGEQAGNTLGSEEVRNFLGAMSDKVGRGVFLTTSTFTQAAERELEGRGVRVVLIKGEELVDFMVEHGVGVGRSGSRRFTGSTKTSSTNSDAGPTHQKANSAAVALNLWRAVHRPRVVLDVVALKPRHGT